MIVLQKPGNKMRERVPPLQNFIEGHQKLAASCAFYELRRGGTWSLIIFLKVFANNPLLQKIAKHDFSSSTPNRLHSISFVKINAPGGFPASRTTVLSSFLKKTIFVVTAAAWVYTQGVGMGRFN